MATVTFRQSPVSSQQSAVTSYRLPAGQRRLLTGHRRLLTAVVLWLLLAPAALCAQTGVPRPPRTGLTVSVHDTDARGVAGATVVVRDASNRVVATVTTSADGIVRIVDIMSGVLDIQITAAGFVNAMTSVRVGAAQLVAVDVTLDRTASPPPNVNAVPRPPGIATPPIDNPPLPPARTGVPPQLRSPVPEPATAATPLAP